MKAKVIMLDSKTSTIHKHQKELKITKFELEETDFFIPQYLYLTNPNAKIEVGDYFIKDKMVCQCNETTQNELGCIPDNEVYCNTQTYFDRRNCVKIIATTNSSLRILFEGQEVLEEPYPLSEQSIKLLVDYYNRKGKMPDEVEVNFEYINKPMSDLFLDKTIKLNSKGEVDIIIPEEKMYSREEVETLLTNMGIDALLPEEEVDEWINENL